MPTRTIARSRVLTEPRVPKKAEFASRRNRAARPATIPTNDVFEGLEVPLRIFSQAHGPEGDSRQRGEVAQGLRDARQALIIRRLEVTRHVRAAATV